MMDYSYFFKKYKEYGEVTEIKYPIISAIGLPSAKIDELVFFESGEKGQIISLHENIVRIMLFSRSGIRVGTRLSRTDNQLSISIGKSLLGKIVNPFATPLSPTDSSVLKAESERSIDTAPSGISKRAKITKLLTTGTAVVDIAIPLGVGQRQLILGDRKTGKSTFVLSTIDSQIQEGAVAIYAAIGKKKSDIKELEAFMNVGDRRKNMLIVATTAFDSPGLIFLTPFSAMTIAEYFRDMGRNVLLIMDDLLTHAKFYREFSLLAEVFPGRDSYPGDIFHVHAKLLERAGNFKLEEKATAAISCFPIVETQEDDFTGYIVSNLMSITDGHLFFDTTVFAQGRHPSINIPLSVTRVGRQTQDKLMRNINRELNTLFSIYEKLESISHFGSEFSESVKSTLISGQKINLFFNQPPGMVISKEVYLILLALIWLQIINEESEIDATRDKLLKISQQPKNRLLLESFLKGDSFNDLLKTVKDNKEVILNLCNRVKN